MMRVWDVEKGALRTVNLQTVLSIKALGKRERPEAPAPAPARDLRAMAALFDNRAR